MQASDFSCMTVCCVPGSVLAYIHNSVLRWATLPGGQLPASSAYIAQLESLDAAVGCHTLQHVSYSLHGSCMVAGQHTLVICDPAHRAGSPEPFSLRLHTGWLQQACLSPDGTRAVWLAKSALQSHATIWMLVRPPGCQARARVLEGIEGALGDPAIVSWHPSGLRFVVATRSNRVLVCSCAGQMLQRIVVQAMDHTLYAQHGGTSLVDNGGHPACEAPSK